MTDDHRSGGTPDIWVLIDDRAGNASQCLGVAEAVGLPFTRKDIAYGPLGGLPNALLGATTRGLSGRAKSAVVPPWPDMVIAAGRRTGPIARHIKRQSGGRTRLVQIMDPGPGGIDDFDLLAVPRHDGLPDRANLLQITGAPHRVTAARLKAEGERWRATLGRLPQPRVALIVGGSTRKRPFTPKMARNLGRMVSAMMREVGGSLMITTSRRTGKAGDDLLNEIGLPAHVYRWGDAGENPYFGYLALADGVVVTGESVSMCSEACATTGPVFIFAPSALIAAKHAALHHELFDRGLARPLTGSFDSWTHPPLNAADQVADEIRRRFGLGA